GCYLLTRFLSFSSYAGAFLILSEFNAWIALLNLIPFPGFDGLRAFEWDKTRWGIAIAVSIVLIGLTIFFV
ncbi:MAG TPA: hypothetical protein VJN71_09215, partial [Nitrososphaerales archaeon]|nr:hypothetical protein [Nitrososphaerales archaeon]